MWCLDVCERALTALLSGSLPQARARNDGGSPAGCRGVPGQRGYAIRRRGSVA
jgi:hypothetical protein